MMTSYFNNFNTCNKTTEKPDIHLMDLVNYSNALNQLNVCFFYKYINGEAAKVFDTNKTETHYHSNYINDMFTNPFIDIAMKYQQESIAENIQENMSNMFNVFNPIKNFSIYNS